MYILECTYDGGKNSSRGPFTITGADCLLQGMEYPVAMPGFWRQPLPRNDAVKIDPYFVKFRIYECNPPTVCLGAYLRFTCTRIHSNA